MSRIELKLIPALISAGLLSACSTMPEWTKPTTWIDGVSGTEKPAEKAEAKPVAKPAADASAEANPVIDPLAEEPAGPRIKTADTPTEFPNVNTLVADRDNAQHTADELKGGQATAAAPPPAATTVAKPVAPDATAKPDGTE
jgi:hypothetical protein